MMPLCVSHTQLLYIDYFDNWMRYETVMLINTNTPLQSFLRMDKATDRLLAPLAQTKTMQYNICKVRISIQTDKLISCHCIVMDGV